MWIQHTHTHICARSSKPGWREKKKSLVGRQDSHVWVCVWRCEFAWVHPTLTGRLVPVKCQLPTPYDMLFCCDVCVCVCQRFIHKCVWESDRQTNRWEEGCRDSGGGRGGGGENQYRNVTRHSSLYHISPILWHGINNVYSSFRFSCKSTSIPPKKWPAWKSVRDQIEQERGFLRSSWPADRL